MRPKHGAAGRFGVPDGWTALFQPEAGIVRADLAHRAFIDGAVAHEARLEEDTRVASLDELDAKVVVVTAARGSRASFRTCRSATHAAKRLRTSAGGDPLPVVARWIRTRAVT